MRAASVIFPNSTIICQNTAKSQISADGLSSFVSIFGWVHIEGVTCGEPTFFVSILIREPFLCYHYYTIKSAFFRVEHTFRVLIVSYELI